MLLILKVVASNLELEYLTFLNTQCFTPYSGEPEANKYGTIESF
jgi:hypothetical protein